MHYLFIDTNFEQFLSLTHSLNILLFISCWGLYKASAPCCDFFPLWFWCTWPDGCGWWSFSNIWDFGCWRVFLWVVRCVVFWVSHHCSLHRQMLGLRHLQCLLVLFPLCELVFCHSVTQHTWHFMWWPTLQPPVTPQCQPGDSAVSTPLHIIGTPEAYQETVITCGNGHHNANTSWFSTITLYQLHS